MAWYKNWFDTEFYHLLYCHRDMSEAEGFIALLKQTLQLPNGAKVLDVACGKGRHSITLNKLGLDVTGIDLSANSITEAKKWENETLHFAEWDMRQTFRKNDFDVVVNLFSSFGYFDDNTDDERAINAMSESLKPGGILVLDYINTQFAVTQMKPREIINRNEIQFHIQKKVEDGFIKKKIEFIANGENLCYEEQLKVINKAAFEIMFMSNRLTIEHTYGDYALQPFNAATSPRLILIGKKI